MKRLQNKKTIMKLNKFVINIIAKIYYVFIFIIENIKRTNLIRDIIIGKYYYFLIQKKQISFEGNYY